MGAGVGGRIQRFNPVLDHHFINDWVSFLSAFNRSEMLHPAPYLVLPFLPLVRHPNFYHERSRHRTVVCNKQELRRKYWTTRSSVCLHRSHRSLVRLLRTARFACALRFAHLFARSLTSLTPSLVGKLMIGCLKMTWFCPIVHRSAASVHLSRVIFKRPIWPF